MREQVQGSPLTRRSLLSSGALAAALAGMDPEALFAAETADCELQSWDRIAEEIYPWGWIRWTMNAQLNPNAEMTVGIVQIEPHQTNTPHLHPNCTEILHVVSGSCEHWLKDRWYKLKTGDTLRIPQNAPHYARTGDEPCRSIVLYNTGTRQMVRLNQAKS